MRKLILIAAMVLASATAQAGVSRGLTLASNDEPAAAEAPKAVEQPKDVEAPKAVETATPAEAPKYVERPPAVDTTTQAPNADAAKPGTDNNLQPRRAEKPRHRHQRYWTESRIIGELHRYGIYW